MPQRNTDLAQRLGFWQQLVDFFGVVALGLDDLVVRHGGGESECSNRFKLRGRGNGMYKAVVVVSNLVSNAGAFQHVRSSQQSDFFGIAHASTSAYRTDAHK